MGARIIELAEVRARKFGSSHKFSQAAGAGAAGLGESAESTADVADRFHFWSGASGRRYVHTIHSLVECPPVAAGNYLLVHRDPEGRRRALAAGRVTHAAACLNLAEIRHRGAVLGANEVHIHLLAETATQSKFVEFDLRSAQLPPEGGERAARH